MFNSLFWKIFLPVLGTLAVFALGCGMADRVLPGEETNVYGQRMYHDLDELIENSELIVQVRMDGDSARPKSYLLPFTDRIIDLVHESELDWGGGIPGNAIHRPEEILFMFNVDDLTTVAYDYTPTKLEKASGLLVAPPFSWLYEGRFKDSDPLAHKGMYEEGYQSAHPYMTRDHIHRTGGYRYGRHKELGFIHYGNRLVYVRNVQKLVEANLYQHDRRSPSETSPVLHAVLFLKRAGPLDNDLDGAAWREFFELREREDGLDWILYREAGDPAIALVEDGKLRFLPSDSSSWPDRESQFQTTLAELAARLSEDNNERFAISPHDVIEGYSELLNTDWGRFVTENSSPGPDGYGKRRPGIMQWVYGGTLRDRQTQLFRDHNEGPDERAGGMDKYDGVVRSADASHMKALDEPMFEWHSLEAAPIPGARTVYTFLWNVPPPLPESVPPDERMPSDPSELRDVLFASQQVFGRVQLLPENIRMAEVDATLELYAARMPEPGAEGMSFTLGGELFVEPEVTANDLFDNVSLPPPPVGDAAFAHSIAQVDPSRDFTGALDTLVFRRGPVIVNLQVAREHETTDVMEEPLVLLLPIAQELDRIAQEFITEMELEAPR